MYSSTVVCDLLQSCYTGVLQFSPEEIVNYLTAASYLQMDHIVERCRGALKKYMQLKNPKPPKVCEWVDFYFQCFNEQKAIIINIVLEDSLLLIWSITKKIRVGKKRMMTHYGNPKSRKKKSLKIHFRHCQIICNTAFIFLIFSFRHLQMTATLGR